MKSANDLGIAGNRRRLILMRHASVEYFDAEGRALDPRTVRLTSHGEMQAAAAASVLENVPFDLALCSGLIRTRQTAEIVLGERGVALTEDHGFKEIRGGRLRELPPESLCQKIAYPYELAMLPDSRFLGGENFSSFSHRVLDAWNALLSLQWSHALVVAHDAVNRVLLGQIASGVPLVSMHAFEQDPACINIIDLDIHEGQVRRGFLRLVNYTPINPSKDQVRLTVMESIYNQFRRL